MPRNKEFEPEKVLKKAMELFWRKGYLNTSIDDLVEHTGVNRYGLYSTFGDKHKMFLSALDLYRTQVVSVLLGPIESPDASLAEIHRYFDALVSTANTPVGRWGCLVCNTAVELAPFDKATTEKVNALFMRMKRAFLHALNNAQHQGELPEQFDVDAYADYLVGVAQGLFVLLRSAANQGAIQRFIRVALAALA
jgi:TetR/AcrR family transcriptional regulator, transcriptional repressor for nem operon